LGAPGRPVVAIVGDGGLQFSFAELTSAVEARVPVILMLHDNKGYGEIKSYMVTRGIPPLGVDILTPDLEAVARACGWTSSRLIAPADLATGLHAAKAGGAPHILIFGDDFRQAMAKARTAPVIAR
jgi:acetolactate synthase-1/2/3 large subunit